MNLNIKLNKKIIILFLLICLIKVNSLPYPKPEPEAIIKCFGYSNETICGKNGECKGKVIEENNEEKKIKMCVCNDKYGSLSFDKKPCLRIRVSKSLIFWIQIFLGWFGVSAFILNWLWYGLAIYIVYGIICCCCCSCLCILNSKTEDEVPTKNYDSSFSCLTCIASCVILGIWIATLVYICIDCYSVIKITSGDHKGLHSLKCWINM